MASSEHLRGLFDRGVTDWVLLARLFEVEAHVVHGWLTSGRCPAWASELAAELLVRVKAKQPLVAGEHGVYN